MRKGWMRPSLVSAVALLVACSSDSDSTGLTSLHPTLSMHASDVIPVSGLDELYAAVNDPTHAGMRVELAPRIYMLDKTREHGGRIELQKDMTLAGQFGDQSAVIIDASGLSPDALKDGSLVTGAVRMGRGSNTVEWLTVRNATNGVASITTDLLLPGTTTATIAHVIASGSPRGFDIRNLAAAAGRALEVVLIDNELADNTSGTGQGMRIANLAGANGASIHATLSGNYAHGNIAGLVASNVGTQSATVEIESKGDRFDGNGNGTVLLAGLSSGAIAARGNLLRFAAHTSSFSHNTGALGTAFPTRAGIAAYGGVSVAANGAFDNIAELDVHSAKIDDNGGPDIAAWGAISSAALPAGTGNLTSIVLRGSSKKATVDKINSAPDEPAATNRVTVVR